MVQRASIRLSEVPGPQPYRTRMVRLRHLPVRKEVS